MSTMHFPTTAEVLSLAADIIEEQGLHRGSTSGPDGSLCTISAISHAAFRLGFPTLRPALNEMEALLGISPGGEGSLARWSDTKALDAADVANHLRKTAERFTEASS